MGVTHFPQPAFFTSLSLQVAESRDVAMGLFEVVSWLKDQVIFAQSTPWKEGKPQIIIGIFILMILAWLTYLLILLITYFVLLCRCFWLWWLHNKPMTSITTFLHMYARTSLFLIAICNLRHLTYITEVLNYVCYVLKVCAQERFNTSTVRSKKRSDEASSVEHCRCGLLSVLFLKDFRMSTAPISYEYIIYIFNYMYIDVYITYVYTHIFMIPIKTCPGSFRTIFPGDGRAWATDVLPLVVNATQRVSWNSKPIY